MAEDATSSSIVPTLTESAPLDHSGSTSASTYYSLYLSGTAAALMASYIVLTFAEDV